jgi:hypothetical protein
VDQLIVTALTVPATVMLIGQCNCLIRATAALRQFVIPARSRRLRCRLSLGCTPLQGLFSSAEGAPSFFFAPLLAVGAVVGAHFSTRSVITDIAEGSAVGLRSAPPGTLPMPRKYGPPTPLSEWSRPASGDPRLTSWDGYTHSSR